MTLLTTEERLLLTAHVRSRSDPYTAFENLAAAFFKKTGLMAPGKDEPAALYRQESEDHRQRAWAAFLEDHHKAVNAALAKALECLDGALSERAVLYTALVRATSINYADSVIQQMRMESSG